ncbi:unnamed protein product [Cutaneotrichosporon oleaginosum]
MHSPSLGTALHFSSRDAAAAVLQPSLPHASQPRSSPYPRTTKASETKKETRSSASVHSKDPTHACDIDREHPSTLVPNREVGDDGQRAGGLQHKTEASQVLQILMRIVPWYSLGFRARSFAWAIKLMHPSINRVERRDVLAILR